MSVPIVNQLNLQVRKLFFLKNWFTYPKLIGLVFSVGLLWGQKIDPSVTPSFMKDLIKKKYSYQSQIDQKEYLTTETIYLSNQVTKGNLNVAGKPIIFKLIQHREGSLWNHLSNPFGSSDQNKETKNLWSVINPPAKNNPPAKKDFTTDFSLFKQEAILSNGGLSDRYGKVDFELSPPGQGNYTLAVFFLHSKDRYTEHANFLSFSVYDSKKIKLNLLTPFILISLSSIIMLILWFTKGKKLANALYYPTLFLLQKKTMGHYSGSRLIFYQLLHLGFLLFMASLIYYFPYLSLVSIVLLLLCSHSLTILLSFESLIVLLIYFFLLQYGQFQSLLEIVHQPYLLFISLVSFFFQPLAILGAVTWISWLHQSILYNTLIYFLIISIIGSGIVITFYHHFFVKRH